MEKENKTFGIERCENIDTLYINTRIILRIMLITLVSCDQYVSVLIRNFLLNYRSYSLSLVLGIRFMTKTFALALVEMLSFILKNLDLYV